MVKNELLPDEVLISAIRLRRSERAFRTLYRRHAPALFAFALRVADTDADAEDLTQETWVKAVELLHTFQGASALRTWLIGIAINCQRNSARYLKTRQSISLDGTEIHGLVRSIDDQSATRDQTEERLDMMAGLRQLPPGYRHVLILHDVEGYKHTEIADILGIGVGTSKSQLHHARRTMRTFLTHKVNRAL